MGAVVGTVGAGGAVVGGGAVVVGTALVAAAVVVVASALTLDVSLATLPGEHPEANSASTRAAHTTATRFLANAIRNSSPVKSVRIILSERDPHVAAGLASGGVARWAVYDPVGAGNCVVGGQAAFRYSLMKPSQRAVFTTWRCLSG